MDYRSNSATPILFRTVRNSWYVFGLWLQFVIVGVGMLATGVALLVGRVHQPAAALVWLIGGGAVTAFAWRNSAAALGRLHRAEERAEGAESNDNLRTRHNRLGSIAATLFGRPAATAFDPSLREQSS